MKDFSTQLSSPDIPESDNQPEATHLSRQGPHQKRKAKSQGTLSNTAAFSSEPQELEGNVLTRLHSKVCCPIFQGAKVRSNMCCMGGVRLWGGKGHNDVR